jgi:hypothetical protein
VTAILGNTTNQPTTSSAYGFSPPSQSLLSSALQAVKGHQTVKVDTMKDTKPHKNEGWSKRSFTRGQPGAEDWTYGKFHALLSACLWSWHLNQQLELIKGHVIIGSTQLQNAFSENH